MIIDSTKPDYHSQQNNKAKRKKRKKLEYIYLVRYLISSFQIFDLSPGISILNVTFFILKIPGIYDK